MTNFGELLSPYNSSEVIGQSLRLLLNNVVDNEQLDTEILEHLLMGLADKQFSFSLELTKFAVKVAVSLR